MVAGVLWKSLPAHWHYAAVEKTKSLLSRILTSFLKSEVLEKDYLVGQYLVVIHKFMDLLQRSLKGGNTSEFFDKNSPTL